MVQTVNGKKVVAVIDYDLAYCEDLFIDLNRVHLHRTKRNGL